MIVKEQNIALEQEIKRLNLHIEKYIQSNKIKKFTYDPILINDLINISSLLLAVKLSFEKQNKKTSLNTLFKNKVQLILQKIIKNYV